MGRTVEPECREDRERREQREIHTGLDQVPAHLVASDPEQDPQTADPGSIFQRGMSVRRQLPPTDPRQPAQTEQQWSNGNAVAFRGFTPANGCPQRQKQHFAPVTPCRQSLVHSDAHCVHRPALKKKWIYRVTGIDPVPSQPGKCRENCPPDQNHQVREKRILFLEAMPAERAKKRDRKDTSGIFCAESEAGE